MRAAEVAGASGDEEFGGFGAVAEAPVLHREKAGGGEGVEQAGQAVGVDAEAGRQFFGRQLAIGERGEEIELHAGQEGEGGDDGVLQPLDHRGLQLGHVRHGAPSPTGKEHITPGSRTIRGAEPRG